MSNSGPRTAAFVRHEPLPAQSPPVAETGAIKWVRENLFSSVTNGLLTIAAIWAIYSLLSVLLPWLLNGVWNAESVRDCNEQLAGSPGGCFAAIGATWRQMVFGIYPNDIYWRPVTAFVMLWVAFAPVLFQSVPRKLLYFTLVYPFIGYWLIWGGTILVPAFALLGVVLGYVVYSRLVEQSFAMGFLAGVLTALIFWWLSGFVVDEGRDVLALREVTTRNVGGFMLNMILGVV